MNAMTGADFTCYPAASQVEKDYFNLFEVYLRRRIPPSAERGELPAGGGKGGAYRPIRYTQQPAVQRVVFNEMKGSLSSPDSRLWHEMIKLLTPDLPYAHNSGGDPLEIPDLTYEQLIHFYETYYHPSQCLFFLYGSMPLKKNLDFCMKRRSSM
jgi:Zn-dependent M16 (insulinase) family peptidase